MTDLAICLIVHHGSKMNPLNFCRSRIKDTIHQFNVIQYEYCVHNILLLSLYKDWIDLISGKHLLSSESKVVST